MAQRFEWYSGPMNEVTKMYEPFWKGQSFTPQITHKITSVRLYCYRVYSASSFKLTADIYAAPSNTPVGPSLAHGEIPATILPESWNWVEVPLNAPYAILQAGAKYAVAFHYTSTNSNYYVYWSIANPGDYAGVFGLTRAVRTIPEMAVLRSGVSYCRQVETLAASHIGSSVQARYKTPRLICLI